MILAIAAIALAAVVAGAAGYYLSDAFAGKSVEAEASELSNEIRQIQGAIKMYRGSYGRSPSLKEGSLSDPAENDLLAEGLLEDWPEGWQLDAGSGTIYNEAITNGDDKVCSELRQQFGESEAVPSCSASDAFPCCNN